VILDSWATIETHSVMLRHLEDTLGHQVHYEMADKKIRFREHEQWLWDNVILMAPSIKESVLDDSIKVEKLIEFFEAENHNIIAFGDIDARKHFRSLALKFGVDYEPFHY